MEATTDGRKNGGTQPSGPRGRAIAGIKQSGRASDNGSVKTRVVRQAITSRTSALTPCPEQKTWHRWGQEGGLVAFGGVHFFFAGGASDGRALADVANSITV